MRKVLFLFNDIYTNEVNAKVINKLKSDKYFMDKYTILTAKDLSNFNDFISDKEHNQVVILLGNEKLQPNINKLARELSLKLPLFIVVIIQGSEEFVPLSLQRDEYIDFGKDDQAIEKLKDKIYKEERYIYV